MFDPERWHRAAQMVGEEKEGVWEITEEGLMGLLEAAWWEGYVEKQSEEVLLEVQEEEKGGVVGRIRGLTPREVRQVAPKQLEG